MTETQVLVPEKECIVDILRPVQYVVVACPQHLIDCNDTFVYEEVITIEIQP